MTAARITSVVVVHGSPAETVRACVQSLLDSVDVDVHVVLVDNASPDGGAACAPWRATPRVTIVRSLRNGGFAAGVNQGLARQRPGDLVMLLNDDATVSPEALTRCASQLATHPEAIAIAPRVMLANEPDRIDSIGVVIRPNGEAFNAYIGQPWTGQVDDGAEVFGPCFGAAMFRPNAFGSEGVGSIDERYFLYYEDIDWGLRARRSGWSTVAATDAIVFHQHAASTRLLGEPARYELVQRNLLLCVAKNFSARRALAAWAQRIVVHAKGLITGPHRAQRVLSIGSALLRLPGVIVSRHRVAVPANEYDERATLAFAEGQFPQFNTETYRATRDCTM